MCMIIQKGLPPEQETKCIFPTYLLLTECDTKSILGRVKLVWIQNFPSPRLVANPELKSLVCLPIPGNKLETVDLQSSILSTRYQILFFLLEKIFFYKR